MVCLNVKVSKATLDTHKHTYIHCVIIFEKLVGSYLKYMYVFNVRMHLKLCALPCHSTAMSPPNESSVGHWAQRSDWRNMCHTLVSLVELFSWQATITRSADGPHSRATGSWVLELNVSVYVCVQLVHMSTDWLTDWLKWESRGTSAVPQMMPFSVVPKTADLSFGEYKHTHTHTLAETA